MRSIAYCLIVVCGILGFSDLIFAQTPTATPTPQAPTVTTNRIIHLDENSVALYGTVNANGLLTTVWAEYGTNSSSYDNTSSTQGLNGTTTQRVRFDISGLSFDIFGGENFYYRIAAQNSAGTSYGSKEGSGSVIPGSLYGTSITDDATNITANSVTLNGRCNVISPSRWFEYDTISGEYFYEVAVASCSPDGYCATLSGLSPATTYFYRMAGQDKNYVYYGETKSFTTLDASATPTPTPDLTPISTPAPCNAVSLTASPKRLILQRGQSREVTVTVKGDNCIPEGKTVTATIGKAGSRRISISSASEVADANGEAKFTIAAKDKIGKARIIFKTGNLKKTILIKIK